MKAKFALLLTITTLLGCMTVRPLQPPAEGERIKPEPLAVTATFDVYQLRVDLNRRTTTRTQRVSNPDGTTSFQRVTEDVPYHYLGVYLGNGIFLDANFNLCLDLVRLLELDRRESFTVTRKVSGLFGSTITYKKAGDEITIDVNPSLFDVKQNITLLPEGAALRGGLFSGGNQDIYREGDTIVYDPHGIFGEWSLARLIIVPGGAEIPNFWRNARIQEQADGSIALGEYITIENRGREVVFTFTDLFGFSRREFRLIQTPDRILYLDDDNRGVEIQLFTDGVVVTRGFRREEYSLSD